MFLPHIVSHQCLVKKCLSLDKEQWIGIWFHYTWRYHAHTYNVLWPKHLKTLHHNHYKNQDPHSYPLTLKEKLKKMISCLNWNNSKQVCRFCSPQNRQWVLVQYLGHRKIYRHLQETWPEFQTCFWIYFADAKRTFPHISFKERHGGQLHTDTCTSTKREHSTSKSKRPHYKWRLQDCENCRGSRPVTCPFACLSFKHPVWETQKS